jgi:hypothetical protein
MAETRIELTGWKAIAVAALILTVGGVRSTMRFQSVPEHGKATLREWLVKDYIGRGPKDLARRVAAYRAGLPDQQPEVAAVEPRIEFKSLSAHGSSDTMIVRCEIAVDGGGPPDGMPVRFLFLTTRPGGGWMVLSECDSHAYYTALLDVRSRYSYRSD